jgi:hypothetical protein
VVYLLVDWYSKLLVAVRWCDSYSTYFKVGSGLRQGSSLSPALFNVFINKVIVEMERLDLGCYLNRTWVGCVLYADDIILLSASVTGLQAMLNKCNSVISNLHLSFNCDKSLCIAFGKRYNTKLPDITLNNCILHWCHAVKYLGVIFNSGLRMKFDSDYITRKFYAASNCVFNHSSGLDDLLQLYLQQSYCLPILQYAMSALRLSQTQIRSLNACWNDADRKIIKFHRWESVSEFIYGLGHLNFSHLWYLSVMKFLKSALLSSNVVLCNSVRIFIQGSEHCKFTNELNVSLSQPMYLIRQSVYAHFEDLIESV